MIGGEPLGVARRHSSFDCASSRGRSARLCCSPPESWLQKLCPPLFQARNFRRPFPPPRPRLGHPRVMFPRPSASENLRSFGTRLSPPRRCSAHRVRASTWAAGPPNRRVIADERIDQRWSAGGRFCSQKKTAPAHLSPLAGSATCLNSTTAPRDIAGAQPLDGEKISIRRPSRIDAPHLSESRVPPPPARLPPASPLGPAPQSGRQTKTPSFLLDPKQLQCAVIRRHGREDNACARSSVTPAAGSFHISTRGPFRNGDCDLQEPAVCRRARRRRPFITSAQIEARRFLARSRH